MTLGAHSSGPAVAIALAMAAAVVLGLAPMGCLSDQIMVETLPDVVCGDGLVEGDEACDDGNVTDGDGCSAACVIETRTETDCGDGMDNDDDGLVDCADSDCAGGPVCTPVCGDGVVAGSEACDDGNNTDGDGCSATCEEEVGTEILCEDRVDNDGDGFVDCLDPDCADDPFCLCGNGVVDSGEGCDDGNNTDGDGCSSSCQVD